MQRLRIVLGMVLLSVVALFASGCMGDLSKIPFTRVTYSLNNHGTTYVIFKEDIVLLPNGDKLNVWVSVENVSTEIDDSLSGTMISATPDFYSRFNPLIFYKATTVIVWVQNDEQKKAWDTFIDRVKQNAKADRDRDSTITPSVVLP